jgi:hypothetical protein
MKKLFICLMLSLALILSTSAAVFAVDDPGLVIVKDPIVKPMVDDPGL